MSAPLVADFTVPVYNEEHVLRVSIERLHAYLSEHFPFTWQITIADNASTDGTRALARQLAAELPHLRVVELDRKGRGLALRTAWLSSEAEIVAYMDVDLSTGLNAILPMIAAIRSGHSELGIGSRLAPGALVARGPRREFISRSYNRILRLVFLNRFRDAQCGFKAIRTDIAHRLLPLVEDNAWFFDTELLLIAEHNGLRIIEVPVDWVDDPDSRVHVVSTATDDLKGVARVASTFIRGGGRADLGDAARPGLADDMGRQLVSFGTVGVISTAVTIALFLVLRNELSAGWAAGVSFTAVAAVNSWANRRFTFGHRARTDRGVHFLRLTLLFLLGLGVSVLAATLAHGARWVEVVVLLGVWALLALLRLGLLRSWVFRPRPAPGGVERTRWAGARRTP
ncbi:MAG TPA: sugar translocase [Acidimicrobiaceae bacterium]|nr:sugar translocase [Acidimicrobiaceae bacterium]